MKRLVIGYDKYRFGHRAVRRFGTSNSQAADDLIIGDSAPAEPLTVGGIGDVYGAAISPDSEVRAVEIVTPSTRLPVTEGNPLRARVLLGQDGKLRIDALEAHDGALVLLLAETPEECDALPTTDYLSYRTAWMRYHSADVTYRVFAYPQRGSNVPSGGTSSSTWEPRSFSTTITGGYVDDGTNTDGDHTIEFSGVELDGDSEAVRLGRQEETPTWQATSVTGAVAISGGQTNLDKYGAVIESPFGRRGAIVAVTTASQEGVATARTLHRINIWRNL